MAQPRLPMRNIREALRLAAGGLSNRQIAASLSVSKTTIKTCLERAAAAGLAWPLPDDLTDAVLEARLYQPAPVATPKASHAQPDWATVHRTPRCGQAYAQAYGQIDRSWDGTRPPPDLCRNVGPVARLRIEIRRRQKGTSNNAHFRGFGYPRENSPTARWP